jgi:hypothetical protein
MKIQLLNPANIDGNNYVADQLLIVSTDVGNSLVDALDAVELPESATGIFNAL